MAQRYVLLDRDGTLIVERHYLADPAQVELLPGAARALVQLRALGWGLAVITNQSGIGRGYYGWEQLHAVHARLAELLAHEGASLDGIYICPHRPDEDCACRKPRPGLIWSAAAELHFDPRAAVVVGDKLCDLDAGRAVGATTCLVRTGYGRSCEANARADGVLDDLRSLPQFLQTRDGGLAPTAVAE
jgi:D-glycero-D-manno-heptose 1,7-bisphosphate phosphatase